MTQEARSHPVALTACFVAGLVLLAGNAAGQGFVNGWNHPWAGYGTDFGSNGWGHSGMSVGLLDDAGVGWLPGTLGSGTLANHQCVVNLAGSAATPSGANLTLVLSITFSGTFAGPKEIYVLARSTVGPVTGWQVRGAWTPSLLLAHALQVAFHDAEDRVRDPALLIGDEFHPST